MLRAVRPGWVRGRAIVTCSNSGPSRTPHPLTPQHWQTHCHGKLTTGNHWHMPPSQQSLTPHYVPVSAPRVCPRPCHVSRTCVTLIEHVSSLSRGLWGSCGLCHVSRCDLVTQCCHDSLSLSVVSVCCHSLSHTDTGLSLLWPAPLSPDCLAPA